MSTDTEHNNLTRGSLRLASHAAEIEEPKPKLPRQFVNFTFYRARPEWRLLTEAERQQGREAFTDTVDGFRSQLMIHTYSTIGLRTNTDFMIWRIGYELEPFQEMTSRLNKTEMAKYLEPTQSFLSMTKRSMYIDKDNPEHVEDRLPVCLSFCEDARLVCTLARAAAGDDGRTHPHRHKVPLGKAAHDLFVWTRRSGIRGGF